MEKTKGSCVSLHALKVFRPVLAFVVSIAIVFSPVVGNFSLASAAAMPAGRDDDRDRGRDNDDRDGDKGKDRDFNKDNDKDKDNDRDFKFRHMHDHDDNGSCDLDSARGEIKHVIYIQFDNVHFERDNAGVPSDLELMPHLLNFMENNGTLLTNSHTPLISHTADDIITSLTGVYGDRHGGSVANSFRVYPPAPVPAANVGSSVSTFTYWTDPTSTALPDPLPIMLAAGGKNAPAPWVPFTRAGCNFGAVSIANMELENVTSDITKVFGTGSPEQMEGTGANAVADFEGIAIHCGLNTACASAPNAKPDLLADEPGTYTGFQGLFGHKYVAPFITPGSGDPLSDATGNLRDFDGNLITDAFLNKGFPGFTAIDAAQTLAYVADMQEHGVPVTYAYMADIHDNPWQNIFGTTTPENPNTPAACRTDVETAALGPGDVCKKALADAYDEAFDQFFTRLKKHGIDQTNTLFVISTEEQDHFAGGTPKAACNGVTTFCTYDLSGGGQHALGEIDLGLTPLLTAKDPTLTGAPYNIHSDMAPTFYLGGQPVRIDSTLRKFERATGALTATSLITGSTDNLTTALADTVEMNMLHMITADPQRTPSFVMFGDPDYFFLTSGGIAESPGFAWNHGGIQPEITTTWCGLVGPGIQARGMDSSTFADETDYRPTILALTGLKDDYQHEGRVLVEALKGWAVPDGVRDSSDEFVELARAFKQINAPLGPLAMDTLRISTAALKSNDAGDATYLSLETTLAGFNSTRDAIAGQMLLLLEGAAFQGQKISEHQERTLTHQAEVLLNQVHTLALTFPAIL